MTEIKLETIDPGRTVCVVGRGTANLVHAHYQVVRRTKTMVVVKRWVNDREVQRRFRFDGREVGASEYGGTQADTTCQRKSV